MGRREHQRLQQLDDLAPLIEIDDLHADETFWTLIDKDVLRLANEIVEAFQRDFDEVILRIVSDAKQRA